MENSENSHNKDTLWVCERNYVHKCPYEREQPSLKEECLCYWTNTEQWYVQKVGKTIFDNWKTRVCRAHANTKLIPVRRDK
jgi:hypothetical protein